MSDSNVSAPLPAHSHEGIRVGFLGATVVWLWFLASGWIKGDPLRLASQFGRDLLSMFGGGGGPAWQPTLTFTVLHYAYWCLIAVLILKIVRAARGTPSVLGLGTTLFILAQFLFAGITAIFANGGMGIFAWPSVWLGNFAGWTAAWWLILHSHPELRDEFRHMNDES